MSKQENQQGVQPVSFRGETWYEATNDRSQQVYRTQDEAQQRHDVIDAITDAYRQR